MTETTVRLIDINTVRQMLNNNEPYEISEDDKNYVMAILLSAPTVDAEPVRRGEWISQHSTGHEEFNGDGNCSVCNWEANNVEASIYSYCPNCGAKMTFNN